jgi:hypothetical protein
MTVNEKLAAILAAVQTDPGNRGLGKVPGNNLFTACPGDFAAACRSLLTADDIDVATGFFIPTADPPAFETDGPLGAAFLDRALTPIGYDVDLLVSEPIYRTVREGLAAVGRKPHYQSHRSVSHVIWLEHPGPGQDGTCRSMRGVEVPPGQSVYLPALNSLRSIGIGDGGNEIGMGKIPHETIVANIPNGDLIHCRVPCDHLIVAGVSNWGAYALAAGIYALRGVTPPDDLFDPDREREILEVMVRDGPLVDGVTGKQTATVDGLTWDEYAKPLIRIREVLAS